MADAVRASVRRWRTTALALVIATMAYNLVEAGLALWGGIEGGLP